MKNWKGVKNLQEITEKTPIFTNEDLRDFCIGPYSVELAKSYLNRPQPLKYFKHKKKHYYKLTGLTSRFVSSDAKEPKHYMVTLYIPTNNIMDVKCYCTCKTGMRTLGGCAHSTAALYQLTVAKGLPAPSKKRPSITAQQKAENVTNVRPFKLRKKEAQKEEQQSDEEECEVE